MKKQISAEIIADSVNKQGDRITTFILTFPRFILAELNTHRVFSRNSASSRAIPFKKMVKMVKEDPFIPIAWQKDHKGMQGTEYLQGGYTIGHAESIWLQARDRAVEEATELHEAGVTKQLCNRILEPFMWHTAIVTSTDFENFFKQRCPQYKCPEGEIFRSKTDYIEQADYYPQGTFRQCNEGQAEIHIMELAEKMWDAMNDSDPKKLESGEWHIPFGDRFDETGILSIVDNYNNADRFYEEGAQIRLLKEAKLKIATARCARISYLNFEGKDDYEADIKLHDRLAEMSHWSPFEHCARTMSKERCERKPYSRNFKGFVQYRSLIEK